MSCDIRAKYVAVSVASAARVADRWRAQYQLGDGSWKRTAGGPSEDIYKKLLALGDNPSIEEAASAIGNKSWSYISCDGCGEYVTRAVCIGCYETKQYCKTCVKEAASVLEATK